MFFFFFLHFWHLNLKLKIKYRKRQRRRHSQRTQQETDHKCALISCQQLQLDDWLVCHRSVNSKRTKRATPKLYAGTTAVIKSVIPIQHEMTGGAIYRSAAWFSRVGRCWRAEKSEAGGSGAGQGMSEKTLLLQEAALQENRSCRFRERNLWSCNINPVMSN